MILPINNGGDSSQIVQQTAPFSPYFREYSSYIPPNSDVTQSASQNSMYRSVSDENNKNTAELQQRVPKQSVDEPILDSIIYSTQGSQNYGNDVGVLDAVITNNNDKYNITSKSYPFSESGPQYEPLADNQQLNQLSRSKSDGK
ncbi:unnamed protein product [Colias eurytheme]|nr:unnamed protein product [Colias eurytheme]